MNFSAGIKSSRTTLYAETLVPTGHGNLLMRAYKDSVLGVEHVALINPETDFGGGSALVRVHSECLTGEAFASLKCDCGPQLQTALETVAKEGGVVIYLRGQEGRGIGLGNKFRAYALQETGVDTLDANLQLGLPDDAREYTAAAEILADLGVKNVRLLTNNPEKVSGLTEYGINVSEVVPMLVGVHEANLDYLSTKRERMGHTISDSNLSKAASSLRP